MKLTLKAARVNKGLRQGDAAQRLGITNTTLSCYERGITKPNVDMIEKILTLYELNYDNINWQ